MAGKGATPGGGAVAAVAGAMGAALVSMVANLTVGRKKYAAVEGEMQALLAEATTLQAQLLELADRDQAAFAAVMEAYKLPKDSPERPAAVEQAYQGACLVPLETARLCARVVELCALAAEKGNPNAKSDAESGAHLARAALRSARENVLINLKEITDPAFRARMEAELIAE